MKMLYLPALAAAALAASLLASAASAQETRASALAKVNADFVALDANKDGVVTLPEVTARTAKMKAGPRALDPVHAKRLAGLWFAKTDANKDGKVTMTEARTAMAAIFDRYDLNGDGVVNASEQAAARAAVLAGPKPAGPSGR